jgi:excisionase family DNA binding protein
MTMRYLTAGEAARLLGVKPDTLSRYVKRGKLRAVRRVVRGLVRYDYPADAVAALAADPPRPGRPRKEAPGQVTEGER